MKTNLFSALTLGLALSCGCLFPPSTPAVTRSTLPDLSQVPAPAIARDEYVVNIPDTPPDAGLNMSTPVQGGLIAPLSSTQPAPFTGVLLNSEALAFIETEFRGEQQMCVIQRRADLGRLAARAIADLENYQVAYQAREQEHRIVLTGRDEEITRLYGLANRPSSPPWTTYVLWLGGGIVLGAAGVGITYIATH